MRSPLPLARHRSALWRPRPDRRAGRRLRPRSAAASTCRTSRRIERWSNAALVGAELPTVVPRAAGRDVADVVLTGGWYEWLGVQRPDSSTAAGMTSGRENDLAEDLYAPAKPWRACFIGSTRSTSLCSRDARAERAAVPAPAAFHVEPSTRSREEVDPLSSVSAVLPDVAPERTTVPPAHGPERVLPGSPHQPSPSRRRPAQAAVHRSGRPRQHRTRRRGRPCPDPAKSPTSRACRRSQRDQRRRHSAARPLHQHRRTRPDPGLGEEHPIGRQPRRRQAGSLERQCRRLGTRLRREP